MEAGCHTLTGCLFYYCVILDIQNKEHNEQWESDKQDNTADGWAGHKFSKRIAEIDEKIFGQKRWKSKKI